MRYTYDKTRVVAIERTEGVSRLDAIAIDAMRNSEMIGRVEICDDDGNVVMIIHIDPRHDRQN